MPSKITLNDIAQKLNVSCVTVSKALRNQKGVSEELRKTIISEANRMGYGMSQRKSRKRMSTKNIGILVPERFTSISASFDWALYQCVTNKLIETNYFGILEVIKQEDEMRGKMPKVFDERHVDAVILLGQMDWKYVRQIQSQQIPMVLVDFYTNDPEIDAVITGGFTATYQLTEYLHECGHDKIGFVGQLQASSSIDDRFYGYMKSMMQHGCSFEECMKYHVTDRTHSGYSWQMQLPDLMPTAFVCNCDWVAYNFIRQLRESGYRVPTDISVVGFDNYGIVEMCEPALTTVEIDMNQMADVVVELLLRKLEGLPYNKGLNIVAGKVIYKESVCKRNLEK